MGGPMNMGSLLDFYPGFMELGNTGEVVFIPFCGTA